MVERFEKFSYLISELSKLLHKLEAEELMELGVKGPYAIYILALAKSKSGISMPNLSKICARDKADVSRAVAALIEKGLAKKLDTEQMKYRAPVILTEKGFLVAERISDKARRAVEIASEGISDADRKTFYDTLETICSNMTRMSILGVSGADEN